MAKGDTPRFKSLVEIMKSEVVIKTAIHKIKANKGSETAGSDGETMRKDILEMPFEEILERVQKCFEHYESAPVRRKLIPKAGKKDEFRPLGIPTIIDRIVQECVRIVIEPFLEAQFFSHSYGFRPMRDTHQAFARLDKQLWRTGYNWIIEGDISKFFDNVNHRILLNKLWHMGVRDRRVLMIIKKMLQAGVMGEIRKNSLGTPQGGIISPLLANVYLHSFDEWVTREWENKKTKTKYKTPASKQQSLMSAVKRGTCKLKPVYLVRYADDWVLLCRSKSDAEKWKNRIAKYLSQNLKLKLSEEKTLITNIRKRAISFLGFSIKTYEDKKAFNGWQLRVRPDKKRLQTKVVEIKHSIQRLKHITPKNVNYKEYLCEEINLVNSKIRGVIQYYSVANRAFQTLSKYDWGLSITSHRAITGFGAKWKKANKVNNLTSIHQNYKTQIPAVNYNGLWVGITRLMFTKWEPAIPKNQEETPYTAEGRSRYSKRTKKKSPLKRMDEFLNEHQTKVIRLNRLAGEDKLKKYNFEYLLNRAYTFNRDKGKCRICRNEIVSPDAVHFHHVKPKLQLSLINRVGNLATTHPECHRRIHNTKDYSHLDKKTWRKIQDFREKLKKTV